MVTYMKTTPINHILIRPDMYVGSKLFQSTDELVYAHNSLTVKPVSVSFALLRCFVEILSNAVDNHQRRAIKHPMTTIRVVITPEVCSVWNDGDGIPIVRNVEENLYNHTLIFGHLLSGSNYDDTQQRLTSGRNGLGAKLTNVFSQRFEVEGVDTTNGFKFKQVWENNMRIVHEPEITPITPSQHHEYTKVTWTPDFEQFGITQLSQDMVDLYSRYVVDAAMITGLQVYLNDHLLMTSTHRLVEYAKLIDPTLSTDMITIQTDNSKVLVTSHHRYEHYSFVNGVYTKHGGKHLDAWVEAILRPVMKKLKGNLTLKDVKPYFRFFVVTTVPNPTFDAQEKHTMTGPSVIATPIKPYQVSKILKWDIGESLKQLHEIKSLTKALKTLKQSKTDKAEGYDKANYAGGRHWKECTLIVCEGLSAKTFTVSGIEKGLLGKKGRDWFGIYPLRGKLMNVRNATPSAIVANTIVTQLLNILGLDINKPNDLDHMNYGQLCIITDADVDGIHIEGLILNLLHVLFPKLLNEGFVLSMKTPIMKTISSKNQERYYFDERTYNERTYTSTLTPTTTRYFKGLGTHKPNDIQSVFGMKVLRYCASSEMDNSFRVCFDKKECQQRREWIESYVPETPGVTLDDMKDPVIQYDINTFLQDELVKFSYEDCHRSLPSVIDGLKESQRKILYAAKKKGLIRPMKVAQFGGYVAEHTNYHHGEQNLHDAIIKMAQSFPGTNNMPLFSQDGMFGTRLSGGTDAASSRYIYTCMTKACKTLFPGVDDALLSHRMDDGDKVEPYHYTPLIPLLLVNGCVGIGTGWSTSVPCYAVKDVVENTKRWIKGEALKEMVPSFNGFNGDVKQHPTVHDKYITSGSYHLTTDGTIMVTELPVGLWNDKFKRWCGSQTEVMRVKDNSTTTKVCFELTVRPGFSIDKLENELQSIVRTDNMVVFDKYGNIVKVNVQDVYDLWGDSRKVLYNERQKKQLSELEDRIERLTYHIKFISLVQMKTICLTDLESTLRTVMQYEGLDKFCDMLLNLSVRSLTLEKRREHQKDVEKLQTQYRTLKALSVNDVWLSELECL